MSPAPARSVPTKRGRYYRDPKDGTLYPSVTTILDTSLNKKALVGWAAKATAQAAVDHLPELVRRCRTDRRGAVTWLKGQPYAARDTAANLGTRVHDLAEAYVLGQPYTAPDDDTDEARMLAALVAFLDDFRPRFEATELTVVNRSVGYAGTLDAIATIPALGDRLTLVDYKTGRTGPYPEWGLQLAAYAAAEAAWLKDGTEVSMPKVDGAAILRIRPDGYTLHPVRLDGLLDTFERMAAVTRWVHAVEDDTCIGEPLAAIREEVTV